VRKSRSRWKMWHWRFHPADNRHLCRIASADEICDPFDYIIGRIRCYPPSGRKFIGSISPNKFVNTDTSRLLGKTLPSRAVRRRYCNMSPTGRGEMVAGWLWRGVGSLRWRRWAVMEVGVGRNGERGEGRETSVVVMIVSMKVKCQ
jgi:hypothetical protein